MHDLVTTALDILGVLLLAVGVAFGLYPVIGGWSVAVAGLVVLGGSQLAVWLSDGKRSAT